MDGWAEIGVQKTRRTTFYVLGIDFVIGEPKEQFHRACRETRADFGWAYFFTTTIPVATKFLVSCLYSRFKFKTVYIRNLVGNPTDWKVSNQSIFLYSLAINQSIFSYSLAIDQFSFIHFRLFTCNNNWICEIKLTRSFPRSLSITLKKLR